ncbi:Elongation factor Ts, mitochondrial [Coemansia sp. RSA 1939]|nr:Elongation factor Ts, mitochondrial [Coemansia sp. RSA 1939]KAJ2597524.1 Elongation factor Ts, mitochondrial [Coemansia sp. RSA 1804]KAJ2652415.1 Elongation factor Ts, mitochondrial [Coemansia sp. RSA 1285]
MVPSGRLPCLFGKPTHVFRQAGSLCRREYATKVDIRALKQLRELNPVSITKAKEALIQMNNDIGKALEWLDKDAFNTGVKKAEKVKDRAAAEGAIAVHVNDDLTCASIVELGCETDFVARNTMFVDLASAIACSAMQTPIDGGKVDGLTMANPDELAKRMLESRSVADTITETIGRLGENIVLRRGGTIGWSGAPDSFVVNGYVHGGVSGTGSASAGKIGGLVAVRGNIRSDEHRKALSQLTKRLAQQVVGYAPQYATVKDWQSAQTGNAEAHNESPDIVVLEAQQFLFGGGTVGEVLAKISDEIGAPVSIVSFVRFERGEGVVKPTRPNFAEEVRRQLA